ncbi:unnamed protein product, partial [Polarella glacialis]
ASGSHVSIHPWEQFVYSFRTKVTSLHHNVSAAIAETFGPSWRPTSAEPIWLLGRRYRVAAQCKADEGEVVAEWPVQDPWLQDSKQEPDSSNHTTPSSCAVVASGTNSGSCEGSAERVKPQDDDSGSPEDFATAWAQITRMTYRKGFAPMYRCVTRAAGSETRRRYIRLTSDAGWGCMIRVGQMLLATALKRHHSHARCEDVVGDGAFTELTTVSEAQALLPKVEQQFLDDPCAESSPFSIFGFIRAAHGREVVVPPSEEDEDEEAFRVAGSDCSRKQVQGSVGARQLTQKLPGDWFGPTTISETIAALVESNTELRRSLAVYVDADGVLYEDEVRALISDGHDTAAAAAAAAVRERQGGTPVSSPGLFSWKTPSYRGRGGHGESDDEFTVLSTPSVSSASYNCSPMLAAVPADRQDTGYEFEEAHSLGADVLQVGSFKELQYGMELCDLQLPPPAEPLATELLNEDVRTKAPLLETGGSGSCGFANSGDSPSGRDRWQRAVLLLFPLQLGCEKYVGEDRVSAILHYFEMQSSLGAMGGRPRMAHFFVGRQGQELLYVDPHVVQPAAVSGAEQPAESGHGSGRAGATRAGFPSGTRAGAETFRNLPTVQTIPVEHIDSSISFAFYCSCEEQLSELIRALKHVEAVEADALIRVEPTRPAALRQAQGFGRMWDDLVLDEEEDLFEETQVPSNIPAAGFVNCGGGGSGAPCLGPHGLNLGDGIPAATVVPDLCVVREADIFFPPGGGAEEASTSRGDRTLCVGAAWSDGAWAQVDTRP